MVLLLATTKMGQKRGTNAHGTHAYMEFTL